MLAHPEPDSTRYISSLFSFSATLLEARDEESVLRSTMRAGCEILSAQGCVFVPFGEYTQTLPALEVGEIPEPSGLDWNAILTHPITRQTCKACTQRHGGPDCTLFRDGIGGHYVHCVPLVIQEREAGLFSFIFSCEPNVEEATRRILAEGSRLASLALDSLRTRMALLSPAPLPAELSSRLPEIETRAILGERMRLAREIHDGLAQTLAFLKIEIGRAERFLEQGKPEQTASILQDSERVLSDAYLDARQAIENLRRVPHGNLEAWLKQVAGDFESITGQAVELDFSLSCDFSTNVKVQLMRIVQEALTNVRKHAAAGRVRITARSEGRQAVIEVADDGRGFAVDSLGATRFGLRGMRERAESIGATLDVLSRPSDGTTVCLRLPFPREATL